MQRLLFGSLVLLWCAAGGIAGEPVASAECAVCHEQVVADLERTSHAFAPDWDADAACQACHGPGQAHIDSGGDIDAIVRPSQLDPREGSQLCLDCHQDQRSHFNARRSIHRLNEVGCLDCHDPHAHDDNMLARSGVEQCGSCHQRITAQFQLPRAHPLGERGAECTSCHNPHGSRSLRQSVRLANQNCGSCHFEKEGPFIYHHDVALVDGCGSCHQVHGSSNRHLLTHETQVNLCYQCHAASATPAWHSAPRFLNEKCTACHAAIHGSNTSRFFLEE